MPLPGVYFAKRACPPAYWPLRRENIRGKDLTDSRFCTISRIHWPAGSGGLPLNDLGGP
jgi:hypothetical protein